MNFSTPSKDISDKQSEINKILQQYENRKNVLKSCGFLVRDLLLNITCFRIFSTIPGATSYVIYSVLQGTLLMSLWVLAHECGHGAFSRYQKLNNIIGYLLHESLLVPYFAWQYTHSKHHKYTNHLIYGETHVPSTKPQPLGDAFVIFSLVFGWPLYLLTNITGGRVQHDMKTPIDKKASLSHLNPWSQIFPPRLFYYVCLDLIGICCVIFVLVYFDLAYYYIGPYLVVNAWLVLYTLLQHTDKHIPHYGSEEFSYLRGALSTVDRKYPKCINYLHHDIGSTHVLHHINHRIAHYHAEEAFHKIYPIIKEHYFKDERSIFEVVCDISKNCHYVESLEGVQFYKR